MMTKPSSALSMKEFKTQTVNEVESWLDFMLRDCFDDAAELCAQFIVKYKVGFREHAFNLNEDEYHDMLVVLVFIKGLLDYTQLCQMTKCDKDWYEKNKKVESVWMKICDCRERLAFSYQLCQGEAVNLVFQSLDKLEEFYIERFGTGSYVSPEIEGDGSLCSICQQDFRACSHIPGRLYNGVYCTTNLIDPYISHIALVDVPEDRRCRIWPWNLEKNQDGTVKADLMILQSFSVDGFISNTSEEVQVRAPVKMLEGVKAAQLLNGKFSSPVLDD